MRKDATKRDGERARRGAYAEVKGMRRGRQAGDRRVEEVEEREGKGAQRGDMPGTVASCFPLTSPGTSYPGAPLPVIWNIHCSIWFCVLTPRAAVLRGL